MVRSKKRDASGLSRNTRQAPVSDRAISSRSRNGIGEEAFEEEPVDAGEPAEVGDRHTLVDLVHGIADEAELDHRADRFEEARIGSAAPGRQVRNPSGGGLDGS